MTQLIRIRRLRTFTVFVKRSLKIYKNVVNVILDAIFHDTVNLSNLMNIKNTVDII